MGQKLIVGSNPTLSAIRILPKSQQLAVDGFRAAPKLGSLRS